MPDGMSVMRDLDTTDPKWSTLGEAVRIVANANPLVRRLGSLSCRFLVLYVRRSRLTSQVGKPDVLWTFVQFADYSEMQKERQREPFQGRGTNCGSEARLWQKAGLLFFQRYHDQPVSWVARHPWRRYDTGFAVAERSR